MTFPFVRTLVERGGLSLHGAYFGVAEGSLFLLDQEAIAASATKSIYPLAEAGLRRGLTAPSRRSRQDFTIKSSGSKSAPAEGRDPSQPFGEPPMTFPFVRTRPWWKAGELNRALHGAYFGVAEGLLDFLLDQKRGEGISQRRDPRSCTRRRREV